MIKLVLKMAKLKSNNGFTIIEVLIVMIIAFGTGSLLINPKSIKPNNSQAFISSTIHAQYMALYQKTSVQLESNILTEFPIQFNEKGNINMGQTIVFGTKKVILMLGTGRIHEKRIYDD